MSTRFLALLHVGKAMESKDVLFTAWTKAFP